MRDDAGWHARISDVLSGALRIWGVAGAVARDPQDVRGFVVATERGPALQVSRRPSLGWTVRLRDPVAGAAPAHHAGMPGLLRHLREELAPGAPAGRLVIGAQPLVGPGPEGR